MDNADHYIVQTAGSNYSGDILFIVKDLEKSVPII
jgi:hypothetical protein